jgi:small subunit ribosomal protein S17
MKNQTGKVQNIIDQQTIKVKVERTWIHPLYQKRVKRSKNYLVQVVNKIPAIGETVSFKETKPISKLKHWVLV